MTLSIHTLCTLEKMPHGEGLDQLLRTAQKVPRVSEAGAHQRRAYHQHRHVLLSSTGRIQSIDRLLERPASEVFVHEPQLIVHGRYTCIKGRENIWSTECRTALTRTHHGTVVQCSSSKLRARLLCSVLLLTSCLKVVLM